MANGSYPIKKKEAGLEEDGSHIIPKKEDIKMEDEDKSECKKEQQDSTQQDNTKSNCVDGHKTEPTPSTSSQGTFNIITKRSFAI